MHCFMSNRNCAYVIDYNQRGISWILFYEHFSFNRQDIRRALYNESFERNELIVDLFELSAHLCMW